jgi:hypothetical protein
LTHTAEVSFASKHVLDIAIDERFVPLVHEDSELALVLNLDELLAAIGRL